MAQTSSAKKAIRVTKRRTVINRKVKEAVREVRRSILKAVKVGEADKANKLLPKFQAEVDKAVKKGVIKKNTGARYKSKVVGKIRSIESKE